VAKHVLRIESIDHASRYRQKLANAIAMHCCEPFQPGALLRALTQRSDLFGLVFGDQGVGEIREVTIPDEVNLVQGEVDAVIGDSSLWEIVGADTF